MRPFRPGLVLLSLVAFACSSPTNTPGPVGTTTALASSTNPSAVGQSVTFMATVSATASGAGTPTGSVTF